MLGFRGSGSQQLRLILIASMVIKRYYKALTKQKHLLSQSNMQHLAPNR